MSKENQTHHDNLSLFVLLGDQNTVDSIKGSAREHIDLRLDNAGIFNSWQTFPEVVHSVSTLQNNREAQLAQVAIKQICEQFGINQSNVIFDVSLEQPSYFKPLRVDRVARPDNIDASSFSMEVKKRLLANMLIQGGAHMFQLAFLMDQQKLDDIASGITQQSKRLIATTDDLLWNMPEPKSEAQLGTPAGLSWVSIEQSANGDMLCVHAKAIHYPVLVHELAKGVLEGLALWGLPQDTALRKSVLSNADRPELEISALKYGHEIWKRVLSAFPKNITAIERSTLLKELFTLPSNQFLDVVCKACKGQTQVLSDYLEEKLAEIRA